MKKLLYRCMLIVLVIFSGKLAAQPTNYVYSKEKIYIHTNHVFFKPGEQLFFKLYLVNGADNKPSKLSNVAYVEVLGPSGTLVEKQTYRIENGYCEGSYTIQEGIAGGLYKLKAYTTWMLNEKDSSFFVKEFTVQKIIAPRILMKLEFPKKGYGSGDEVEANFSMRDLSDQAIKSQQATFTVSLGGKVKETNTFSTDAYGKAVLKFTLPKDLQTTDGLLNITVNYDAYTESIARTIPITLNKVDLQFMPEGGSLVAGIATNIAFKAVNEYGKPVDAKGIVINSKGDVVANFESYKFGMGKFLFTPIVGEVYKAKITSPNNIQQVYLLPMSTNNGVVMNISKTNNRVAVKLTCTHDMMVKLFGQTKSIPYYTQSVQLKKGRNDIDVDETIFPAGIAQFTIYDGDNGIPLAERLVFLNEYKKLYVDITTDKQKYLPREKVVMTVTTRDDKGEAVPSIFSLAVVDDKLWSLADDKQDNIYSWLLMSSELKGNIEEPQFYFKQDEPKAQQALDLVMLTNGYRYFDFIDYVQQNGELKYTPDEGNMVSGMVTDDKDKPTAATVFLVNSVTGGLAQKAQTGDDGIFYFPNLIGNGDYILLAQSLLNKIKLKIKILQNGTGYNPLRNTDLKKLAMGEQFGVVVNREAKPAPQQKPQIGNLEFKLGNSVSHLDDVVVIGYGVSAKRSLDYSVTIVNNNNLNATPLNGAFQALNGKVAGLQITQNANPGAAPEIMLRGISTITGGAEPMIVMNGIPQAKFDLSNIDVNDISSIEVFKGASAVALYGARAANGVIAIQSKSLRNERWRFNLSSGNWYAMQSFRLNGPSYTIARRFYMPKYQSTITDERNDFRETIYWNPVVQTGNSGKATVEFYNSDATTTFRAIAEGIGYDGKLGRAEKTYAAQSAMSVDAKIPPYLTVGDNAYLPLVIKNNSTEKLNASIAIELPAKVTAGVFDSDIDLEPDSSMRVFIPIKAVATASGNIRFSVTSTITNETIVLPITAVEKGFPVIETFSGNRSARHGVIINKMIPGSLHTKLTLFKDVEGQLLNGIESMLREPHGCFEQTSSSTYPNILILKYLRQSGKSNPAVEKRALDYINDGYKKLVGFETPEYGFEWFGHAPAHEALTAYGLLEFTDMQDFVHVDKAMLQRAKNLLLNRRDGRGGFKLASRGYDEFAAVPSKIADIYIVYALSQAGYGNEFVPEYRAAVKKAMESNDGYQLAMMALAADNMKNSNDYRLFMDLLKTNYTKYKLASETSVVNSRDASLRVESMALYALALARDTMPDVGVVAELVSNILKEKSYYGYGSTQATVLALQAVVEYVKLAGEQAKKGEILFTANGKNIGIYDSITKYLHEGPNTFTAEYVNADKGIPYNLEVAYNTFTPPNSEKAELALSTNIGNTAPRMGETVRMTIEITNKKSTLQPMAVAKIGIPAGLSLQPWQLKELTEKKQVAYYEIFDNYLVLYWMGFGANETKKINLDLKAELSGTYKAKASNAFLYYTPEYKNWHEGLEVEVGIQ